MKALGTLSAIVTLGLAGCGGSQDNFSGVYLNSPIVYGYDIVVTDGNAFRIGNLIDDNSSERGFKDGFLYIRGNFNQDLVRISSLSPTFPEGHDLERFYSIEELERVVREIKRSKK